MLWEELDSIVDQIMSEDGRPSVPDTRMSGELQEIADEQMAYGELRGQAQGVAYAIAVITDPYAPDVPKIREQAMQRWEDGAE